MGDGLKYDDELFRQLQRHHRLLACRQFKRIQRDFVGKGRK
jgi:hypothetical protein